MGLDLRLLPCEHWRENDGRLWGFSHSILELGGICEEAWLAFQELVKPHLVKLPADHNVSSFVGERVPEGYHRGETMYGTLRAKDAYGSPYEVVTAQQILPWLAEHFRYDGRGGGPYQGAVVGDKRALPPDTKIILDWH